jgi:hypothetical protein
MNSFEARIKVLIKLISLIYLEVLIIQISLIIPLKRRINFINSTKYY